MFKSNRTVDVKRLTVQTIGSRRSEAADCPKSGLGVMSVIQSFITSKQANPGIS